MLTIIPEADSRTRTTEELIGLSDSYVSELFNQTSSCAAFDIETAPLEDDFLRRLMPEFVPPPHPGEFDESSVKVGNLKDQTKIKAKVDAAREAHEQAVEEYGQLVEAERAEHFFMFRDRATLDATTGRVIAIGVAGVADECEDSVAIPDFNVLGEPGTASEIELLATWWSFVADALKNGTLLVGFNIHSFDLPFLIRRSWILGVPIPAGVVKQVGARQFFADNFVDLMRHWGFGNPQDRVSLDVLAKSFGLVGKLPEVDGRLFHEFWFSESKEDRDLAARYLCQDVVLCLQLAERMGIR